MAKQKKKIIDKRQSFNIKDHLKKVETGLQNGVFVYTTPLSVDELAKKLQKPSSQIIKYFFLKGKMHNITSILSEEEMGEICLEFNFDFEKRDQIDETNIIDKLSDVDDKVCQVKRAPIITIMGHVDHGKTTLLDSIRKTNVTATEHGGITQHIGAYQITHNGEKITFIDTPGHEAFTEMRARGASVTDIVILVVAADDGIKPQTEEAIDHAKAGNVPIIVFVNKCDKPNINIDKVISQLSEKDLVPEDWGGSTIFVKGSALTKQGINELLESILLLAEMNEYKANPNRLATGVTIEAKMDSGHGPVATVLIKSGTLQKGDHIAIGSTYGKVRNMFDDNGEEINTTSPSQPVKITGLSEVPKVGSKFLVLKDDAQIKDITKKMKEKELNSLRAKSAGQILVNSEDGQNIKSLNVLIKSDVQGSLEAIKNILSGVDIEGTKLNVLRASVGAITQSDVQLAKASNGIIVGFNIKPNKSVKEVADQQNIKIFFFNIIYKLKEDIIKLLYGSLDPVFVEEDLGEAEVKQIWRHSHVGVIVGCLVTSGTIFRNANARVIRDGVVIYTTSLESLRHVKENVTKVSNGSECGIVLKNFKDLKEKDIIQSFKKIEKNVFEDGNE